MKCRIVSNKNDSFSENEVKEIIPKLAGFDVSTSIAFDCGYFKSYDIFIDITNVEEFNELSEKFDDSFMTFKGKSITNSYPEIELDIL